MEKAEKDKKNVEFFEGWLKMQKDFIENVTKCQKEFIENWLEATRKMQELVFRMGGAQAPAPGKEMFSLYNTWFNTMVNSAKSFTDETMKIQESWNSSLEKQAAMGREMMKGFSDFAHPGAGR